MLESNEGKLICLDIFDERWTTFIETQAQANIFHHQAWQNTITQTYGYKAYGLVLQDSFGEIRVALPVANVNSPFTGRRWIAYPFSDHCFPLYRSEPDLLLDLGKTDFENKGLRDFKNKWGAEEQVLTFSSVSSKPIRARTMRLNSIIEMVINISSLDLSTIWRGVV